MTALWETSHPYYFVGHNYHLNGVEAAQWTFHYDTFDEFLAEWGNADTGYNHLFRWDWYEQKLNENTGQMAVQMPCDLRTEPGSDYLVAFFVLQRKGTFCFTATRVTRDDEPKVRKYLAARAEDIRRLWAPLLGDTPAGEEG